MYSRNKGFPLSWSLDQSLPLCVGLTSGCGYRPHFSQRPVCRPGLVYWVRGDLGVFVYACLHTNEYPIYLRLSAFVRLDLDPMLSSLKGTGGADDVCCARAW